MDVSTAYTPVGGKVSRPVPTGFYMLDRLLSSRIDCAYPSNRERYDEDVNIYLAGLLTALIYSERHEQMARLVVPYDGELLELARRERDPRMNFQRYRANADFLLAYLGVFDNPTDVRPAPVSYRHMSREAYIGRGAAYYRLAWSYCMQAFRRRSAVSDVMEKLSRGFERYVRILSAMRGEYLNILPRLSDGEFYHLQRSILDEDRRRLIPAARDAFLDALSRLRRERSAEARIGLEERARELGSLDPSFRFDPDKLPREWAAGAVAP